MSMKELYVADDLDRLTATSKQHHFEFCKPVPPEFNSLGEELYAVPGGGRATKNQIRRFHESMNSRG